MVEDDEKGLERVIAEMSIAWSSFCPKCGKIESIDHENNVKSLDDIGGWSTIVSCCGKGYVAVIKKLTVD